MAGCGIASTGGKRTSPPEAPFGARPEPAAQRGLESGTTPPKVLETVAAIRKESQIPIVLYIYYNLIHRRGVEQFIRDAAQAGVDGLLVLDLPPEERPTGGLGIFLMRKLMDDVHYESLPGGGNLLTLVKRKN